MSRKILFALITVTVLIILIILLSYRYPPLNTEAPLAWERLELNYDVERILSFVIPAGHNSAVAATLLSCVLILYFPIIAIYYLAKSLKRNWQGLRSKLRLWPESYIFKTAKWVVVVLMCLFVLAIVHDLFSEAFQAKATVLIAGWTILWAVVVYKFWSIPESPKSGRREVVKIVGIWFVVCVVLMIMGKPKRHRSVNLW